MSVGSMEQAYELVNSGRGAEAASFVTRLAEEGDSRALALLGVMHFLGEGVERDGPRAELLLAQGAALGDGGAAHNLASLYAGGVPGVPQNAALARAFYRRARAMGAQFALDESYEE